MPAVTGLDLFAVDLPFVVAFKHAAAARTTSDSVFLRVRLADGATGWGECLPRSYVSGERRDETFALLRDAILPGLLGREFADLREVTAFLEKCDGKAPADWVAPAVPQTAAWCAVDLALHDAVGRATGEAVWPGPTAPTRYSGVASAGRGWPAVRSLLKLRAYRFPHVKLKLSDEAAVGDARTARRALGRRVDLRVDANMAWDVGQALSVIRELRGLGIRSIEEPIAASDLAGLARLTAESGAGIMVDEGFTDRESLRTLISRRACTGVNVRISKCGGLVAAAARAREALDAGLVLQVGCQVGESSLLSAAHVALLSALAGRHPGVRYAEGCFGTHLLREDPATPTVRFRFGGRAPRRPVGPGLGVAVDEAVLRRWAVDTVQIA
jgi:muconate cycloisomerase